jgi:SAM-dependent methyltransferase
MERACRAPRQPYNLAKTHSGFVHSAEVPARHTRRCVRPVDENWRVSISPAVTNISTLSVEEALRRRGVKEVVYFHADHFEPWRPVPGRDPSMERAIEDVERFLASTEQVEFARKTTLFYKANVNYLVSPDRALHRADPSDLLGFVPRDERDRRIGRSLLGPILAGSAHEVQVHIHHENYTYNDTARDPQTHAYLQTPRGRCFDNARLELGLRLSLEVLKDDGGLEPARWFFVHGHWALNAADPHECTIVREIEILRRNGCAGDFTQPAGRAHVDSRIDVPYLVNPVAAPKGYDTAEADPIEAAGAGERATSRFLIWASATTHEHCSIDTHSGFVQRRIETPELAALAHATSGVVADGVLYVKTHCHSMHPSYWKAGGRPMPHEEPGVQAELGLLFDAADKIGGKISLLTVSQAYDRLVHGRPREPRDLAREFSLRGSAPMERIGVTVEFVRPDGTVAGAPPLGPQVAQLPAPTAAEPATSIGRGISHDLTVPRIVSSVPGESGPLDQIRVRGEQFPLIDAGAVAPALMESDTVAALNSIASEIALNRIATMGAEAAGVTGFYGPRAELGSLLQPSEVLCAELVLNHLGGVDAVYEIGCGLGLLSTYLAARGMRTVGIERNRERLQTAKAVALQVRAEGRASPRLIEGAFPRVIRRTGRLGGCVALVTNLLGRASESQQIRFILGLRRFGAVLIDAQRFYDRRLSPGEIQGLLRLFKQQGFGEARLAFDLGPDGRFLLFLNSDPTLPKGLAGFLSKLSPSRAAGVTVKP